ncbi:hypothetical protein [Mesorhizobium sp. M0029]|uniref:hypothetical protein n=1 Tax=Mesorhizobium sp. M0029 TaxID=2956850 RepID=UPI00333CCCB8
MCTFAQWGPIISALTTLVVGMMVAAIAYRQWRVAHEKLIVDLFDKRFSVYNDARDAVRAFWYPPNFDDPFEVKKAAGDAIKIGHENTQIVKLHEVGRRARFLFDSDVAEKIKAVRDALIHYSTHDATPWDELEQEKKRHLSQKYVEAQKASNEFPEELARACEKYMRITRAL